MRKNDVVMADFAAHNDNVPILDPRDFDSYYDSNSGQDALIMKPPQPPFLCKLCPGNFFSEESLDAHLLGRHQASTAIACPICVRPCRDIKQHLDRVHPQHTMLDALKRDADNISPVEEEQFEPKAIVKEERDDFSTLHNEALPMNLSVRASPKSLMSPKSPMLMSPKSPMLMSPQPMQLSPRLSSVSMESSLPGRKRRRQMLVPDSHKDEKYWVRRQKNNEAAKRSRDMRIKREKIVFEENARLEREVQELRVDLGRAVTENKELRLKMELVLDENSRLKSVLAKINSDNKEEAGFRRLAPNKEALPNCNGARSFAR